MIYYHFLIPFSFSDIRVKVSLVSKDSSMLDGLENASSEMVEAKVSLLSFVSRLCRRYSFLLYLLSVICIFYLSTQTSNIRVLTSTFSTLYISITKSTQYFVKYI